MKQILCLLALLATPGLMASEPPPPPVAAAPDVADLPTGEVSGLLEMPRHEKMPKKLTGRIRIPAAHPQPDLPDELTVDCPVADGRWVCHLPGGRFDLRLRARGYLSHFLWNVEVRERRRLDLGPLDLRRGASVVGRIKGEGGDVSPRECTVSLSPLAHGYDHTATENSRREQRRLKGEVLEGGFFRFEGVRPGDYVVEAVQAGLGEARLFPVTVMENAETEVQQALVLQPPLDLEIVLQPPLDPHDRPWRWQLHEESEGPFRSRQVAQGVASEDGFANPKDLRPGEHTVTVEDVDGHRFALEQIPLSPTNRQLFVDFSPVWIEGTLRLGEETLSAEIHFGGKGGKHRVILESDEEGKFSGVLPEEGEWKAYIRSRHPQIKTEVSGIEVRRLEGAPAARVTIELPDTEIAGEVVDEGGRPVFAASVHALRLESASSSSARTDRKGRFRLRGLPSGPQMVSAHDADETSEQLLVHAEENRPKLNLRLVLRKDEKISGQVLAPSGGVPGARLIAVSFQADGTPMLLGREATTDVHGHFDLAVPGAGQRIQLAVLAPAYAFRLVEVTTGRREPLNLQVEPQAGSLNLDLRSITAEGEETRLQPVIVMNGKIVDGHLLRHWALLNGEKNADPSRLVVPRLSPGLYGACFHTLDPDFIQKPTANLVGCVEGFLAVDGELELTPDLASRPG